MSCTLGNTQLRLGAATFADVLPLVDLLVQNREEVVAFAGLPIETDAAGAARTLAAMAGAGSRSPSQTAATPRQPPSTRSRARSSGPRCTGSRSSTRPVRGDAFHAGLALGRLRGLPLPEAMRLASLMGSQTCTSWGGVAQQDGSVAVAV